MCHGAQIIWVQVFELPHSCSKYMLPRVRDRTPAERIPPKDMCARRSGKLSHSGRRPPTCPTYFGPRSLESLLGRTSRDLREPKAAQRPNVAQHLCFRGPSFECVFRAGWSNSLKCCPIAANVCGFGECRSGPDQFWTMWGKFAPSSTQTGPKEPHPSRICRNCSELCKASDQIRCTVIGTGAKSDRVRPTVAQQALEHLLPEQVHRAILAKPLRNLSRADLRKLAHCILEKVWKNIFRTTLRKQHVLCRK